MGTPYLAYLLINICTQATYRSVTAVPLGSVVLVLDLMPLSVVDAGDWICDVCYARLPR